VDLEFWKQLLGAIGGLVTLIVAVLGWLKSRHAAASSASSAYFAKQAADQSGDASSNSGSSSAVLNDLKTRFDGVYAALIEERLQETRMRKYEDAQQELLDNQSRILDFMADLETERHTTGNLAEFQRSRKEQS
jgi:hypothetical protein